MTPFARKAAAVLAAAFLLCPSLALAQGAVLQSGPVTAGHVAIWGSNGVIRDAGSVAAVTQSGSVTAGHGAVWVSTGVVADDGFPANGPYLPLAGGTLLGPLTLSGPPINPLDATTKTYVDAGDATNATAAAAAQSTANSAASAASAAQGTANSAAAAASTAQATANTAQTTANAAVPKAGGTMTGALILNANPSANLGAATKQTVDAAQTTANAALPKAGGTMTGTLTLHADPQNPLEAATKEYVDAGSPAASALNVGRNKLHNPLFTIAQRGAGPFTTAGYTLDRWMLNGTHSNGSMSVSQVALTDANRTSIGDQEAQFGYQYTFVGGTGAADIDVFSERIEDVRRLSNTTVTVSFWAFSASGTPKLGVSADQSFGTGGSPSPAVTGAGTPVTISTTPTRYTATLTIPSATGKTLGTGNNSFTQLNIWESSGTTNATRAGSIGVQSGTVTVWGVQLEETTTASPLEKRDPQVEMALCQRFYQVGSVIANAYSISAVSFGLSALLPVTMRGTPAAAISSNSSSGLSSVTISGTTDHVFVNGLTTATGGLTLNVAFTASADL